MENQAPRAVVPRPRCLLCRMIFRPCDPPSPHTQALPALRSRGGLGHREGRRWRRACGFPPPGGHLAGKLDGGGSEARSGAERGAQLGGPSHGHGGKPAPRAPGSRGPQAPGGSEGWIKGVGAQEGAWR